MSVTFRMYGDIAVMSMHSPPVNALGQSIRQGLMDALDQLSAAQTVRAAVLIGEGRCFSAGADITEFGKPPQSPRLHEVLDRLESSTVPIVAAIHVPR